VALVARHHVQLRDLERVVEPGRGRLVAAAGGQRPAHRVVPPLAGRAVEAVAEADRLAGPVVRDRQRAEPRVSGVPGHDRPAARQQLGCRAHRRGVHRDQLVEPGDELDRAQLADRDRSRG
jgi:hypothetical protein